MRILTLWTLLLALLLASPALAISSTSPVWVASDFFKAGTYIITQAPILSSRPKAVRAQRR